MAVSTTLIGSQPGIKRDGTSFDGEHYIDGQWVRFQRGKPRKIWGFRSISKFLQEISRGITCWAENHYQYCLSGSENYLESFSVDNGGNASIITDRTPGAYAAGTLTLTGGGSGSVNTVTVNGVTVTSGAVAYVTSLSATATAVAANITAHTSSPNYTATAVGAIITITATVMDMVTNGYVVAATTTTITTSATPMAGGGTPLDVSPLNMWMFDYQYSPSDVKNYVIAHVGQNLECSYADTGGQIFYGEAVSSDKLVEIALPANMNATGGIVVLHPYLVYYGSNGMIGWSVPGDPTDLSGSGSGQARPWSQKFIKGLPLRAGGGNSPAGIFWAYDAVIRMSYVGGTPVFSFDVLMTASSIMSANCVIDYDGVFYWCAVDRFLMFNGVVREIENNLNINYFLDNIQQNSREKVFAFKVPRFGEIWWCYPRGDAEECTHAIIYNVRENTWYDTELPNSGRSAGIYNSELLSPVLTGVDQTVDGYKVWLHERGLDEIDGQDINAINSYYTTSDMSLPATQSVDARLRITTVEPDFVQAGPMTLVVSGRANARAPEQETAVVTYPENALQTYEQVVMLKAQYRLMNLTFGSNAPGGDYQAGQIIAHIDTGDHTKLS